MRRRDAFPSNFLAAEDLPQQGTIVTIDRVENEKMRDGVSKPVAYLNEFRKPLIINTTKWKVIEALSGEDDTDNWGGIRMRIYPSETQYDGETMPCINVDKKKPKEPEAKKPTKAPVTAPAREPGDDDDMGDGGAPY
jgi:hypothetical protein